MLENYSKTEGKKKKGQELLDKKDETKIQDDKIFLMNVEVQKAELDRSVSGNIGCYQ